MKTIILFLPICFVIISSRAQSCKCSIYPWTPDSCFRKCAPKILGSSSKSELSLILGIESETAEKIVSTRSSIGSDSIRINSLHTYLSPLTAEDSIQVTEALKSLTPIQMKYFDKTPNQRRKIVNRLNALLE